MHRNTSRSIFFRTVIGLMSLTMVLSCADTSADRFRKDPPVTEKDPVIKSSRGVNKSNLTVDGNNREFSYYVPGKSMGKRLPIVIYLHGHGDSMRHMLGQGLVKSASSKWMDVAEREGFLVFYPLGLKGDGRRPKTGWNDCRADAKGNPQVDDIKFVKELINFAVDKQNGDRDRVYVTGMSNGGHMTMRVAMEMSNQVAAVAPIVALLPKRTKCSPPTQPVPILMMHGTKDPIAPFEGGSMKGGRGEVLGARATADTWAKWNRLESVPIKTDQVSNRSSSDDSTITTRTREASPSGNAVVAYEINGAGHTEPSQGAKMNRLLKRVQGNQNNDIEMAETIWEFFKTRSR